MNYKGIVNWLQGDGFVLMGFSDKGEVTLMEKHTGKEVNDLPSFLIATVLPIAKKKITYELMKKCDYVTFTETYDGGVWSANISERYRDVGREFGFYVGQGETAEYAMVSAIENFIKQEAEYYTNSTKEKTE